MSGLWLIAAFAIAFDVLLVGVAFRLKKHATPSTPAAK